MKILTLVLLFSFSIILNTNSYAQKDSTHYVTAWKTNNIGLSNDSAIYIETNPSITYNFDVDWNNDGVFDTLGITSNLLIQYPSPGTYTVRIRGNYPSIFITNDREKIVSIEQWGTTTWSFLAGPFRNCVNVVSNATDAPDLSMITNLDFMFSGATNFTGDLSNWDVSNATTLRMMFSGATQFNSDISSWNVSNATDIRGIFQSASSFNQDINSWDISSVEDLSGVFTGASVFNQNLSNWDVSRVKHMDLLFAGCTAFNQDISSWNVDSVIFMTQMFYGCTNFDQNLGNWNIQSVTNLNLILDSCGISRENYDSLLIGWQRQTHASNLSFGGKGLKYCLGDSARTLLIADGWTFTGDSLDCQIVGLVENKSTTQLIIYPNPTSNIIKIKSPQAIERVDIYSIDGKLILTTSQTEINISAFQNGTYVLHIQSNELFERRKLFVQH